MEEDARQLVKDKEVAVQRSLTIGFTTVPQHAELFVAWLLVRSAIGVDVTGVLWNRRS